MVQLRRDRARRPSGSTLGNYCSQCGCWAASAGGRQLGGDLYCALAVSATAAAGVWLDLDTHLIRYYRRPLPPPLALLPDTAAVAAANVSAGLQLWAAGWSEDDLAAVVFADCALVESLSPYSPPELRQRGRQETELEQLSDPAQLSAQHRLRKKLKSLLEEYDITLQCVPPGAGNDADGDCDDDRYEGVSEKDQHAMETGAALLSAATWLAHHVNADVQHVEERIRQALGDECDLEVEANRATSEPADSLFEW